MNKVGQVQECDPEIRRFRSSSGQAQGCLIEKQMIVTQKENLQF
jgi:hypothetical protein